MLTSAAEDFARAAVPRVVFKAFQQNMTALLKRSARDCHRNVVPQVGGKSLARQFSKEVERGHRWRGTCDTNFDRRQSHCDRVVRGWHWCMRPRVPWRHVVQVALGTSPAWPPPVREGHVLGAITLHFGECEGEEQGDSLMPLFSLGIHDAQSEAKSTMGEEEHLLTFGRVQGSTLRETSSSRGQGSICMRAKRGCGTKKASAQLEWRSLGQRCGAHRE